MYVVIYRDKTTILRRRDLDQDLSGREYQIAHDDTYDDLEARAPLFG